MQIKIVHAYLRQETVQKSYHIHVRIQTWEGYGTTGAAIFWLPLEKLRELCMDRTFRLKKRL